jgi:DNA-binding transcriptional regulator YiaG
LRGVNAADLINTQVSLEAASTESQLDGDGLSELFGIDLDSGTAFSESNDSRSPIIQVFENVPVVKRRKKSEGKAIKVSKKPLQTAPDQKEQKSSASQVGEFTGDLIRLIRESMGVSGAEMADLLGVKVSTIYRWEQTSGILKLDVHQKEAIKKMFQEFYAKAFNSF